MVIAAIFALGAAVTFDTLAAVVTSATPTTITCTTPAGSGVEDVTVTVGGQSVTLHGAFTYGTVNPLPPPQPTGPAVGGPPSLPPARLGPVGPTPQATPNPLPPRR